MRLALLSVLQLAAITLFAQSDTFQLKDYQFRTPGFRALQLNFGIGGNHYDRHYLNGNQQKNQAFYLLPSLVNYYRVSSTDRKLHTSSVTLEPFVLLSSTTTDRNKQSSSQIETQLQWTLNTLHYRKGNWYWETGNSLSFRTDFRSDSDTGGSYRQTLFNLNESVTIGIGRGRIEQVQDAQTALFILNDLKQQGLLEAPVTKELTVELARLITDINNRRVFDFRRRRIYELSRIDSFFRRTGLVKTTDIRHFTTINDNWSFGLNPNRRSGWQWFLRLSPGVALHKITQHEKRSLANNKLVSQSYFFNLSPELGFEKQVPISMKWQHGYGTKVTYAVIWSDLKNSLNSIPNYEETGVNDQITLQAFYSLSFFPNNRTALTTQATLQAMDGLQTPAYRSIEPRINFEMNYFLGYRTALVGGITAGYWYLEYPGAPSTARNMMVNFNLGLSHFFF